MKVVVFDTESRVVRLELTRRNLETLLKKLDFNAHLDDPRALPELEGPRSECMIGKEDPAGAVWVKAVEDTEHYAERPAGTMLDNATGQFDVDPRIASLILED